LEECKVAIIVPAFNEEETIKRVIDSLVNYGNIIVIDDASTDSTPNIVARSNAILVSHSSNQGYDKALNSGFSKALELGSDIIISFDADGQHNSKYIPRIIDMLANDCDVVIGVRDVTGRFSENIAKIISSFFFKISDPFCGLKGYKANVYKSKGCFDTYNSIGTELAIYASSNHFKVCQLDVVISGRTGKARFGSGLIANWKILRAMFHGIYRYF